MTRFGKYFLFALLAVACLSSCDFSNKKRMNERITLKRNDLIPYGTYVAYQNLKHLFPDAKINITKKSPADYSSNIYQISYNLLDDPDLIDKSSLYIIITPQFSPSQREYEALMRFVGEGNHVFISAFTFGDILKDSLNLEFRAIYPKYKYVKDSSIVVENDSLWVSINNPYIPDSFTYTYPGLAEHHNIKKLDSKR